MVHGVNGMVAPTIQKREKPNPRPRPRAPEELDELTLARARRGDQSACRKLVFRYQRPVFALLSRMLAPTGQGSLVEDLAQETFLRVFRNLPTWDVHGRAKLSSWILTVATRLAIDELRRRRPVAVGDRIALQLPARDRTDREAERRALGEAIAAAVSELKPGYRAAFVLREYHHMSYEEISHALKCDLGTVKSRISRARRSLREALREVHDEW